MSLGSCFSFLFSSELGSCIFVFSNDGDAIKVFVRIRPPAEGSGLADGEQNPCVSLLSSTTLRLHSNPEPRTFPFDHVAGVDATQVRMVSDP